MELEVGYGLVRLVDATKGGDLLERISLIRRQIAMDLGIIVPPVRIRDNMQLGANDYVVKIKGQAVGRGVTYPEQFLAMDNGATTGPIPGGDAHHRAGLRPAGLLDHRIRSAPQAELLNYTVVEATAVLATHLTEVIKIARPRIAHAAGGEEPARQSQGARAGADRGSHPDAGQARRIAEGHAEPAARARAGARSGDDPRNARRLLVAHQGPGRAHRVRAATRWRATICKQYVDDRDRLWCLTLDPALEDLINGHLERSERGTTNTMPPQTAAADRASRSPTKSTN